LFGEFKEIWRVWKVYKDKPSPNKMEIPDHSRWELLGRASAAEGKVEGVFVKLAAERTLTDQESWVIGLYRQAYQILRQGIRDDRPLEYGYTHPEYRLFNQLGCLVAQIIAESTSHARPSEHVAQRSFARILGVRTEHWQDVVQEIGVFQEQKYPDPRDVARLI
jgi:hypothetical protein